MYTQHKGLFAIVEAIVGSIDINATTRFHKGSQTIYIGFPRAFAERWVKATEEHKGFYKTDSNAYAKRKTVKEQLEKFGIKTVGTGYEESLYFFIPE